MSEAQYQNSSSAVLFNSQLGEVVSVSQGCSTCSWRNHAGNTQWPPHIHLHWWKAHMQPAICRWHRSYGRLQCLKTSPADSLLVFISRTAQTTAALTRFKAFWNDRSISLSSKIRLMRSLATSIFLYACESWTLTTELQKRIQAMEIRCYRKILCISYKDRVTNKEVRSKSHQVIGPHEGLTIVKRRKLLWFGHVSCSLGPVSYTHLTLPTSDGV